MPAYHSVFLDEPNQQVLGTPDPNPYPTSPLALPPSTHPITISPPTNPTPTGNFALLPLRTRTRGPAPTLPPLSAPSEISLTIDATHTSYDPADEILQLFRANVLFRNFEIHGPADRTLIYGILYVSSLLSAVKGGMGRREAEKALMGIALDNNFVMPGDAGFPLNQAFEAPRDRGAVDAMRGYVGQLRQELAVRLLERLYEGGEGGPSKVRSGG
ncbi:MAG: subunit of the Arp2/3 complex [Chrysothrix sp. TS-e1954]|nr:MAG: subunit of the Arp2/3 complex [Chrysothrix sp. TS-e1954]